MVFQQTRSSHLEASSKTLSCTDRRWLVCGLFLGLLLATPLAASNGWALRTQSLRGFQAATASLIFGEADGGALALAALAVPLAPPDDQPLALDRSIAVFVEIDGPSLLEQGSAARLDGEIYLYALDPSGGVATFLAESFSADLSALGETLAAGGLKYAGALAIAPGTYLLRVLVRHPASGAHGLRTLRLFVPPSEASSGPATGPAALAPQPANRWLALHSPSFDALSQGGQPAPLGGRIPSALPILAAGRKTRLELAMPVEPGPAPRARLDPATPDNPSPPIEFAAELTSDGALSLRLPRVDPGSYRLQVAFPDDLGNQRLSPPLDVWMVSGETPEQALMWTDLRWQIPSPRDAPLGQSPASSTTKEAAPETTAEAVDSRPSRNRRTRKLATAYRETLAVLASHGPDTARKSLIELETRALGRGKDPLGDLGDAEQQVATELADRRIESLVAVLALHLDTYSEYRQRRLHSLVAHSRATIESFADLYAREGGNPTRAADALVSLGADLQATGLLGLGQRILEDANRLAPDHRGALLGLAAGSEKTGAYRRAVSHLEHLHQIAPDDPECQLRLAVNLGRIGKGRQAEALLQDLATNPGSSWTTVVARQQLARRQLETGRADQATTLLERALTQAPGDPGLTLMLAFLYDQQHLPHKATERIDALVDGMDSSAASTVSPTRRYDSWPRASTRDSRQALAAAARKRRTELALALDLQTPESPSQ